MFGVRLRNKTCNRGGGKLAQTSTSVCGGEGGADPPVIASGGGAGRRRVSTKRVRVKKGIGLRTGAGEERKEKTRDRAKRARREETGGGREEAQSHKRGGDLARVVACPFVLSITRWSCARNCGKYCGESLGNSEGKTRKNFRECSMPKNTGFGKSCGNYCGKIFHKSCTSFSVCVCVCVCVCRRQRACGKCGKSCGGRCLARVWQILLRAPSENGVVVRIAWHCAWQRFWPFVCAVFLTEQNSCKGCGKSCGKTCGNNVGYSCGNGVASLLMLFLHNERAGGKRSGTSCGEISCKNGGKS